MVERILIVNADDFGLTPGVCTGILRTHQDGIVTSTSVLATGASLGEFAPALSDSGMGIGAHLAAVGEERPALTASEIPTLVDSRGRFPMSWREFVMRSMQKRVDAQDLAREFSAQLEILDALGLRPLHIDTHQHLHLWPPVGRVVTDLARRFAIPAVRVPRSRRLSLLLPGLSWLSARLRRQSRHAGLVHTGASAGLDGSGHMDAARLVTAIDHLAAGPATTAELLVHPGAAEDPDRARYRWGYSWAAEQAALCDPSVRAELVRLGFTLGTYADLVEREH